MKLKCIQTSNSNYLNNNRLYSYQQVGKPSSLTTLLSAYIPIYPYIYLFIYVSIYLPIYLSIIFFICLSIYLTMYKGVEWLLSCWYHNSSCILADEVGLGKSIQIIGFLFQIKEYLLKSRKSVLYILPESKIVSVG